MRNKVHILHSTIAIAIAIAIAGASQVHAQEVKNSLHKKDSIPVAPVPSSVEGQQLHEPLTPAQQSLLRENQAPATLTMRTDFYAYYEMQKKLKINPYAIKINLEKPSYLINFDGGGGISGFGGGRGTYLNRYAGFDFGGTKGGMQLGVQRAYNPYTGQWEMIPMAAPYVNIGGHKVGFDIGGMVYSILREASIRNNPSAGGDGRSGIIAPPQDFKVGFDSAPEIPVWMEKQFEQQ